MNMGSTFNAVGFSVPNDDIYNRLAEHAGEVGFRTLIYRRGAKLHGRCFKLGHGLEVWTILYESEQGLFYVDCRPAFRPDHIININPWELTEYDEEGEAIVKGIPIGLNREIIFELQNLTELEVAIFRQPQLPVALAGLAYSANICTRNLAGRFVHTAKSSRRNRVCENDYRIRGRVLTCRRLKNPVTGQELVWVYLDTDLLKLEVVVNAEDLRGEVKVGSILSANIWLQGYIFNEDEIAARYEGVDRSYQFSEFWSVLKRDN